VSSMTAASYSPGFLVAIIVSMRAQAFSSP
jgi:hypothetical protein